MTDAVRDLIGHEASYSALQAAKQCRKGEALTERLPDAWAVPERNHLERRLQRPATEKEWQHYRRMWSAEAKAQNDEVLHLYV